MDTQSSGGEVLTQAFVSPSGERKVLIVNKRDRTYQVTVPEAKGGKVDVVDQITGAGLPASTTLEGDSFSLGGFGVAVVSLPRK